MVPHPRHTLLLTLVLVACAPPPLVRTPSAPKMATAGVRVEGLATHGKNAMQLGAREALVADTHEPAPVVLREPLLPPNGAICYLRGTGDPFSDGCEGDSLSVAARKDGSMPVAQFDGRRVDITWAFFEGRGRPWVGVRSGGLTLTGFANAAKTRFELLREIAAVDDHIWFEPGATIRVIGGKGRGLDLSVEGDMGGVESIVGNAPCDVLSFDPTPKLTPIVDRAPATEFAVPARSLLPLRLAPRGAVVATLNGSAGHRVPLVVDVLEKDSGFTRIAFDTTSARFDVWVADSEIKTNADGFGSGTGFGRGCGGSNDYGIAKTFDVLAETRVIVAKHPTPDGGPDGLTLAKGTSVIVVSQRNGFSEIAPRFTVISPPPGLSFWVRDEALREHAPRAR